MGDDTDGNFCWDRGGVSLKCKLTGSISTQSERSLSKLPLLMSSRL